MKILGGRKTAALYSYLFLRQRSISSFSFSESNAKPPPQLPHPPFDLWQPPRLWRTSPTIPSTSQPPAAAATPAAIHGRTPQYPYLIIRNAPRRPRLQSFVFFLITATASPPASVCAKSSISFLSGNLIQICNIPNLLMLRMFHFRSNSSSAASTTSG